MEDLRRPGGALLVTVNQPEPLWANEMCENCMEQQTSKKNDSKK